MKRFSAFCFSRFFRCLLIAILLLGGGNVVAQETWTLVTDVSILNAGDEVVIAASASNYALFTTQNSNNRGQAAITKSGNTITLGSDVQILTLKAGNETGTFAFYTGAGYLYAASSSSNYLKTETNLSNNSSWSIAVTNAGIATIKAQGNYTRNWLRYNSTSGLFSCYSSGQKDVQIYKKESIVTPPEPSCTTPTIVKENGTYTIGSTALDLTNKILSDNTNDFTFSCSTEGCTVSGNSFTAIKAGTYTISAHQDADGTYCEVNETFDVVVSATIQFSINGVVDDEDTQVLSSGTPTAPTVSESICGSKVFVGWTTAPVTDGNKPSTLYATAELPAVSGDTTYYAVFANATSGGTTTETKIMTITRDNFGNASGYAWHAWTIGDITGQGFIYGTTTSSMQFNGSKTGRTIFNEVAIPGNITSVTMKKASNTDRAWNLYCGTTAATTESGISYGTQIGTTQIVTTEGVTWTVTGSYNYFLLYENETSASYISEIVITYETTGTGGTTYSDYITECAPCSNYLDVPTGLAVADITSKSAVLSWEAVPNATSYEVTIIDGDSYLETLTVIAPSCSCTVNNLSPATDYTWAVKAKSNSADYCDSGDSQDNDFTTKPLETFKITWQNNGEEYATTTVPEGSAVELPEGTPASCSAIYSTFEGWFTESAGSEGDPADELPAEQVTAATIPTANTTYYAVFSDGSGDGVKWNLVSDASTLTAGDKVIIVAATSAYAMSTTQNENNRGQIDYIKGENPNSSVQVFTLQAGTKENTWSFYTGDSYLRAASSSANHLKVETSKSDNSSWDISINSNVATITAQGNYTRNVIQYNSSSSLFSCYNSSSQQAIQLYKKSGTPATGYISTCCNDPAVVTIEPTASTINLGEDGTASTTVTCSQEGGSGGSWSYSVSPDATATFDGKTFTATAVGDYRLVATYTENCGKTAICNIKVTATPVITFATERLDFEAVCNEKGTGTVEVSGYNCNEKVYLELSNEVADKFYFSPKTLTPDADGKVSGTITVTYKASLTDETESYNGTLSATCGTTSSVNNVAVTATKSTVCPTGTILFKYIDQEIYSSTGFQDVTISAEEITNAETAAKNRVCHTPIDYQFVGWSEKQGEYIPVDVSSKTYIASGRTYYAAYQWIEGSIETLLEDDFAAEINSTKWTTSTCYYENEAARIASGNKAGYLKATINATVGSKISISFDAKKYDSDAQNIVVKVGTETIATITNTTSDYSTYTYEYTLISDNPTISFECTNDHRAYIDNVLVKMAGTIHYTTQPVCCPTVLPKPSVWTTEADGAITLHWSLSENADKVTDFTVICRGETSQTLTFDKDTRSHTFTGLTNCNTYTFSVRANGDNTDVCSSLVAYTSAKPSAGSYTVTFDYGAGTGTPANWTSGCDNGTSVDLPTPTPPENHTFVEWRAPDGTVVTSPYEPTADITLYARYKRNNAIDIVDWGEYENGKVGVTLNINDENAASVSYATQEAHGSNNVATGIFFSKYFEATGSLKLLGIYNGTGNSIDLTNYSIRIVNAKSDGGCSGKSQEASDDHSFFDPDYDSDKYVISFGENGIPTLIDDGEEWIFYAYKTTDENKTVTGGTSLLDCINEKIQKTFEDNILWKDRENWYQTSMEFGGRSAVALFNNADRTKPIDIIGAWRVNNDEAWSDGEAIECCATNGYGGDSNGWIEDGEDTDGNPIKLSTNRCLLIRKNSVKSGENAVIQNKNDNHTFATLGTEWMGIQVLGKSDDGATNQEVCDAFSDVAVFDYRDYHLTYDKPVENIISGNTNVDGTYTIPIDNIYELPCTMMKIETIDGSGKVITSQQVRVPIIVKEDSNTDGLPFTELAKYHKLTGQTEAEVDVAKICSTCDVVVKNNATLSHKNTCLYPQIRDLYIYSGARLDVENGTYNVNSLTMRSRADQVSVANVDGNLTIADKLYHSKRIDGSRFYFFTLPYDCNVSDITYSNGEVLGISGIDYLLKYYDGAGRAAEQNAGHWEIFTGETLEAGKGYIIAVEAPLNGDFEKNPKKEILFPMTNALAETENKTVKVGTYGVGDNKIGDNHKGWNLIGVPFMSNYNPLSSTGLKVGKYEEGEWNEDKLWIYNSEVNVPYVTMPNDDGKTYTQVLASAQNLEPFRSFFVQVGKEGEVITDVAFDSNARRSAAPRSVASLDGAVWVKLTLNKGELSDATTIIVDDARTTAYEIGADLEKMLGYAALPQFYSLQSGMRLAFNALSSDVAASAISLGFYAPTNDTYTISLNSAPSPYLEGVYLTDNFTGVTTNLLHGDYTFTSARAANDTRFSVAVVRSVTAVDNVLNAEISAYVSNRELHIDHAPVGSKLYVFDTLGREIIVEDINAETLQYNLPVAGVYHVQIVSESAKSVYKVVCY